MSSPTHTFHVPESLRGEAMLPACDAEAVDPSKSYDELVAESQRVPWRAPFFTCRVCSRTVDIPSEYWRLAEAPPLEGAPS